MVTTEVGFVLSIFDQERMQLFKNEIVFFRSGLLSVRRITHHQGSVPVPFGYDLGGVLPTPCVESALHDHQSRYRTLPRRDYPICAAVLH